MCFVSELWIVEGLLKFAANEFSAAQHRKDPVPLVDAQDCIGHYALSTHEGAARKVAAWLHKPSKLLKDACAVVEGVQPVGGLN